MRSTLFFFLSEELNNRPKGLKKGVVDYALKFIINGKLIVGTLQSFSSFLFPDLRFTTTPDSLIIIRSEVFTDN